MTYSVTTTGATNADSFNGVLLVDKPEGWTSFDVVNYVRKIVATHVGKKPKHVKVGHTGTLDPLATGLLVLLLGNYTKRAPELSKLDKTYDVYMKLGQTSSTGDEEGEKTAVSDQQPSEAAVLTVLKRFTGALQQTPPIYSAVKVGGERAYKLARQGKPVVIEPRSVTIHSSTFMAYDYPMVHFVAHVSSGTYIRSLVEDMGKALGTGAYMTKLCRTGVGMFGLDDAVSVNGLSPEVITQHLLQP